MKKYLLLLTGLGLIGLTGWSQLLIVPALPQKASHAVSLDVHLPAGVFARSQFAGAGLNYSWSHHRFGQNVSPSKRIGFTANGGADYYFGKKVKTAGYDFRYGGYIYLHALAGLLVNPWPDGNISLVGGPTRGIYEGNADTGFGVNLFGSFYLKNNIAIGPGIMYKKHAGTDALWTGAVRASYTF